MLLRDYEMTFSLPACMPSAKTIQALAKLSDDIGDVLPYLNALVRGAAFDPEGCTLRFWRQDHAFTIFRDHVNIAKAIDAADAREAMDWLKDFINDTYERRDSLEPSYRRAMELKPLQLYQLLPGTNCKECGEATCFAFAARLLREDAGIECCLPFSRGEFPENREKMIALFQEAGRVP